MIWVGRASNIFMGAPGEELPELELTHNYGVDGYELGTAYGHVALTVDDLNVTLEHLKEMGIEPEKPPYRIRAARGSASSGTPTDTGSSYSSWGAEGAPPSAVPDRVDAAPCRVKADAGLRLG